MPRLDNEARFKVAQRGDPAVVALREFQSKQLKGFDRFSERVGDFLSGSGLGTAFLFSLGLPLAVLAAGLELIGLGQGIQPVGGFPIATTAVGIAAAAGASFQLRRLPRLREEKRLRRAIQGPKEQSREALDRWIKANYGLRLAPYQPGESYELEGILIGENVRSSVKLNLLGAKSIDLEGYLVEVERGSYELHKAKLQDTDESPYFSAPRQLSIAE